MLPLGAPALLALPAPPEAGEPVGSAVAGPLEVEDSVSDHGEAGIGSADPALSDAEVVSPVAAAEPADLGDLAVGASVTPIASPGRPASDDGLVQASAPPSPRSLRGYVVSISLKQKFRRLHYVPRCGRYAGQELRNFEHFGTVCPPAYEYDESCRS